MGSLSPIDWKQIVASIPNKTYYNSLDEDRKYAFLKKQIENKILSPNDYESAINSLSDFLNY